jgi:hypothetical protein
LRERSGDDAHEIIRHVTPRAEHLLDRAAEHVEREHVEREVQQAAVQERVRDELQGEACAALLSAERP